MQSRANLKLFNSDSPQYETKISISTSHTIERVSIEEILYLEGKENYCRIKLINGDTILANKSLGKQFEELNSFDFFLCHKSYVVNMEKVIRYWRIGIAELEGGERVPVARRRREAFRNQI